MTVENEFMFDVLEEQASCHDIVIESAKQLRVSLNFSESYANSIS